MKAGVRIMNKRMDLEDFGFSPGPCEIWYLKAGELDLAYIKPSAASIDRDKLEDTHVCIGSIAVGSLDDKFDLKYADHNLSSFLSLVYHQMQGENWSPKGQAKDFILACGTGHTSMSMGDVVVIGDRMWVVAMLGFTEIK